ncbi:hypothetical protein ACTFIY_002042 [Dictyostelium cf. discoideum]
MKINKNLSNYIQSYLIEYLIEFLLVNKKLKKINKKILLKNRNEILGYSLVCKYWFNSIKKTIKNSFNLFDFGNYNSSIKEWWLLNILKNENQLNWSLLEDLKNQYYYNSKENNKNENQKKYIDEYINKFNYQQMQRIWGREEGLQPFSAEYTNVIYNIDIEFMNSVNSPIIPYSILPISGVIPKRKIKTNQLKVIGYSNIMFQMIRDCFPKRLIIEKQQTHNMGNVWQHHNFHEKIFKKQPQLTSIIIDMNDYIDPFQLSNIHKLSKLHTLSFHLSCHTLIKQCYFYYENNLNEKYSNKQFELYNDGDGDGDNDVDGDKKQRIRYDLPCKCNDEFDYSLNLFDVISDLKAMVIGICKSKSLRNIIIKNRCHGRCIWENDVIGQLKKFQPEINENYILTHCFKDLFINLKSVEFLKLKDFDFLNEFSLSGLIENQGINKIYFKNSLISIDQIQYLFENVFSGQNKGIKHLIINYDLVSDLNKGNKIHSLFNQLIINFLKNDNSSNSTNLYSITYPIDLNQIDNLLETLNNYQTRIVEFNLLYLNPSKIYSKNIKSDNFNLLKIKINSNLNINSKRINLVNKYY